MKKIIVAPLNWGLGHASRCVPIIHSLLDHKFTPIIASDGEALLFLKKEFPGLEFLALPSYQISYAKNLKWSLFLQLPKILRAVRKEHKLITKYIEENEVVGIISDNRFGVRSTKTPSVYITHQLNVLAGVFTFFTTYIHQRIIRKFDECWIPDNFNSEFSGKLSASKKQLHQKYIGLLSRFELQDLPIKNDVLIILSGIESQRIQLENKMKSAFENFNGSVVMVQGNIAPQQSITTYNSIKIYNYMLFEELQKIICESKLIICRAGYSSIMDLAVLQKRVVLIPTKHQTEQEYLAYHLNRTKGVVYTSEENFTIAEIKQGGGVMKLTSEKPAFNSNLFRLFKGE